MVCVKCFGVWNGLVCEMIWFVKWYGVWNDWVCEMVWCVKLFGVWNGMVCEMIWCVKWFDVWNGLVCEMVCCVKWFGVCNDLVCEMIWCVKWCGVWNDLMCEIQVWSSWVTVMWQMMCLTSSVCRIHLSRVCSAGWSGGCCHRWSWVSTEGSTHTHQQGTGDSFPPISTHKCFVISTGWFDVDVVSQTIFLFSKTSLFFFSEV